MKKNNFIILIVLCIAISLSGCTEQTSDTASGSSDGFQQVQMMSPIEVHSDYNAYWAWHNETRSILENKIGTKVKLYAFNIQYKGKLLEVTEFYAVVDDNVAGEIYIDIDSINAIGNDEKNLV
ncbi:hypothetical protein [Methanolobus vulcani]|jgi:hypothetical protein|nr:hypothetical protein [Methanolobus vulcani]